MKKNIIIVLLSAILAFLFFKMNLGKSVEYEVLSIDEVPSFIQTVLQKNNAGMGFSIFQDENNSYIYYKSSLVSNEYITTDIDIKVRGSKYIAIAIVRSAVNNSNTDRLIKIKKIVNKDIMLKENIKRGYVS